MLNLKLKIKFKNILFFSLKLFITFLFIFIPEKITAQSSNIITYKIIVKDSDNNPLSKVKVLFGSRNGETDTEGAIIFEENITSIFETFQQNIPITAELSNNYPNPFSSKTETYLNMAKDETANIRIYNILGENVFNETKALPAGRHHITLDNLSWLASGVYFINASSKDFNLTKKMMKIGNGISGGNIDVNVSSSAGTEDLGYTTQTKQVTLRKGADGSMSFPLSLSKEGYQTILDTLGIATQDTTIYYTMQKNADMVSISGMAMGVNPDSSKAYAIPFAIANIREFIDAPADKSEGGLPGEVVSVDTADAQGHFEALVEKGKKYMVQILDDEHHEKILRTNPYVEALKYNHVVNALDNIVRDFYVLSKDIDKVYFYGVVKNNGDLAGSGAPLAKWNTESDGYAHPKVWIQECSKDKSFSDQGKQYVAEWADSVDAGIRPEEVADSSQADVKVYFVPRDHPMLGGASGRYITHVDESTNRITGAEIYIWEEMYAVQPVSSRERLLKEEIYQSILALHDITVQPYVNANFFGNASTNIRPEKIDRESVFKPIKDLPKDW